MTLLTDEEMEDAVYAATRRFIPADAARAIEAAVLAKLQAQEIEYNGWYCAHCQRGVDASEVTYHEQHTVCGRVITEDKPPKSAPVQAQSEPVAWFIDVTEHGKSVGRYEVAAREHWGDRSVCIPLYAAPVQTQGEPVQFAEIAIGVLGDRNGFDNWWDDLDKDLQQEILEEIDSAIGEKAKPVEPKGTQIVRTPEDKYLTPAVKTYAGGKPNYVAEVECNPHPDAPHGFDRNGSHNAGRYVCECEGWDAYSSGFQAGIEHASRSDE